MYKVGRWIQRISSRHGWEGAVDQQRARRGAAGAQRTSQPAAEVSGRQASSSRSLAACPEHGPSAAPSSHRSAAAVKYSPTHTGTKLRDKWRHTPHWTARANYYTGGNIFKINRVLQGYRKLRRKNGRQATNLLY